MINRIKIPFYYIYTQKFSIFLFISIKKFKKLSFQDKYNTIFAYCKYCEFKKANTYLLLNHKFCDNVNCRLIYTDLSRPFIFNRRLFATC